MAFVFSERISTKASSYMADVTREKFPKHRLIDLPYLDTRIARLR